MQLRADELLAGPRGRRVCWELLTQTGGWGWEPPPQAAGAMRLATALGDAVVQSDIGALRSARDPGSFLAALADSVAWARYWQEPDDWDRRLSDQVVAASLAPVAAAISAAPAAQWWTAAADPLQHEVVFDEPDHRVAPEPASDTQDALLQWRRRMLENERRSAEEAAPLQQRISGVWWSTPNPLPPAALRSSTRSLGPCGPVGLHLVEDELGWKSARCWRLHTPPGASILEIRTPADWGKLVARFPLPVPSSRRHDWWRATGQDLDWAIPDYPAVAAEYDAIHLTVAGYLSTAGRAIAAGDAHTVLAGWGPDQTWWLTRTPTRLGEPVAWIRTGESGPFAWVPGPA